MARGGALEPPVKEMLYLAVSTTNGCEYCIRYHTAAARKAGMSEAMLGELMAEYQAISLWGQHRPAR
jgi:AhpD family alkylhydroperoxidase